MKLIISLSAKQVGTLYHYTNKTALLKILRSGKLALSTGRGMSVEGQHQGSKNFFASLTRSRFGGYHFREKGHTSIYENTAVMITLDGDALSNREKLVPVDYWQHRGVADPEADRSKEVEERLISNKSEIPILKYIKRIDLVQRGVLGELETYGFDKGKFKLKPNEAHQFALGSIVLQLKKLKIPFAFYDNMDDWAKKRGEYTYIGPKDVSVTEPRGYPSKHSYKDMEALVECLSELPYEKLSKQAQERCTQAWRYPTDIDAIFNDYENFRKPDASAMMRPLALKIARQMQRRGFTTKKQAGAWLANKAKTYYDAIEKQERDKRNKETADLIAAALTKPLAEWPEHKNNWIAPKSVFGGITERYSYMGDEAERLVTQVLLTDAPEIDALRKVMKSMRLETPSDVVSHIFYEKVKPTL